MRNHRLSAVPATLLLTMCILLASCSKKQDGKPKSVTAPSPMADSIRFQYAVYMLPVPSQDPVAVLGEELKKYPDLKLVDEIPKEPQAMLVGAHIQTAVQKRYPPPDMRALRYFGNGISHEQALALQKSREAFILDFTHPKQNVWVALQNANSLVENIARKTGGLVWDAETREIFPPNAWHARRLQSWKGRVPAIATQTLIHAYQNGEYIRAITLGMAKAGLPDVVIENSPWSAEDQVGDIINVFCQSIAEGAGVLNPGKFKIDLHALKNAYLRDAELKSLKPNGTGMACLLVRPGRQEEGDPANRLIELSFDNYPGPDAQAKQANMRSSFFGWEESVQLVRHNETLLEESRKEREKLPELHKAFDAGLQPGEFIEVKSPFKTPDGDVEWMWVEITSWKANHIKGLLRNEPFKVSGLHSGQIVNVQEEDVFDYIHQYPDEHREGNTTGAILQKMDQEKDENFNHPTHSEIQVPPCE